MIDHLVMQCSQHDVPRDLYKNKLKDNEICYNGNLFLTKTFTSVTNYDKTSWELDRKSQIFE